MLAVHVELDTNDGPIRGYLALPQRATSGPGPWPAVVVVHEIFGVEDDIRQIAERFATAGYVALVPDLYSRGGAVRCVKGVVRALRSGRGQAVDDLTSARRWLAARGDTTGRVGIAGFCLGGGFALLMAPRGFDVAAPYYGVLPEDESAFDGSCPVVASFGGRDRALPGAAARLEEELAARHVPHDVKEYPEAGHSFANRSPVALPGPLKRVAGVGYHHASAEDAWRRVFDFFAEHLRGR